MPTLHTEISGLKFRPPLILASGVMGQTAGSMRKMVENGMGGIVTKSIGLEARKGHPNPSVVEMDTGLLNAMGLPNPGIDEFGKEMDGLDLDVPVIGSVYGSTADDFVLLSEKMQGYGADAVELNLSCPHAEGYGASIGSDIDLVGKIVENVVDSVDIPVFPKIPPTSDTVGLASQIEESGADAIVAVNTVKAMAINYETAHPILGNVYGGYSGPGIKPIGLRCVYEIYGCVDIPIIGCGGITNGRDALEYIMAGSTSLEIGSSIYYRGLDAADKIHAEMNDLVSKEGFSSIDEMIGAAHR